MFLPHPRVKVSIVGSLRDREVACSASDRQGSNFESCVWRTVSSQSYHPQGVLLAQFSLYVHKGGLKPDSFHLLGGRRCWGVSCKMYTEIVTRISLVLTLSSSTTPVMPNIIPLIMRQEYTDIVFLWKCLAYIAGMLKLGIMFMTCFNRYRTVDVSFVNFV